MAVRTGEFKRARLAETGHERAAAREASSAVKPYEQIREVDFKKILNYYKNKGQFHHQALTALYLYTSMKLESMFSLRWKDVYDFDGQSFVPYPLWLPGGEKKEHDLSPALIPALAAHMKAAGPLPGDPVLDSGGASVILLSFQVISEAMAASLRCRLLEPRKLRQAFKNTAIYRRADPRAGDDAPATARLTLLRGNLSAIRWNRDYETRVAKQDLTRLLNDCLKKRQFQSHAILTLYLYSEISVKDMARIRWGDVYQFGTRDFRSQIMPMGAPLGREIAQALLACLAQRPDPQPGDFVLAGQGKPMDPNAIYRRIRAAMGRLADMRLVRIGELREWARQTVAAAPPRKDRSAAYSRHRHVAGLAALKARIANRQ
jgi:integrase